MNLKFNRISREQLREEVDSFITVSKGTPHDNWEKKNYLSELAGKWQYSVAARSGDILAGYILTSLRSPTHLHIHRFIVNSRCRGQGVGRQMLDYLEEICRSEIELITLKVYADNREAIGFYEQMGFVFKGKAGESLFLYSRRVVI